MSNAVVSKKRHIAKAMTWRIVATSETILLAWILTARLDVGASIGAVELFSKTMLYYLHERAWYRTKWGVKNAATEQANHTVGPTMSPETTAMAAIRSP